MMLQNLFILLTFDSFIGDGMRNVLGSDVWLGVLTLVWFGGFLLMQNVRLDVKLAIWTGAAFLSLTWLPWLTAVVAIILAVVLYLALMKLINR